MIGIIADTHGLLRPEALVALDGCTQFIHAGDLGKREIFDRLSRIAPTAAIRGNVDRGTWAEVFPETLTLSVQGIEFYVLHDLHALSFDPPARKIAVVISGHSHQPKLNEKEGVIYLNPGSAGPRRFSLPVTVARLEIGPHGIRVEIIDVLRNVVVATLSQPSA